MLPTLETLNDNLYIEWGKKHGLKAHPTLFGNARSLRHLVDDKFEEDLKEVAQDHTLQASIFDHARYFVKNSDRTKVSVIATAPYEKTTLEKFGSMSAANTAIYQLAQRFNAFVRIGHPEDVTYLSRHKQIPIIPIIWWNPSRFELPYPSLEDQYETHRHRWQE